MFTRVTIFHLQLAPADIRDNGTAMAPSGIQIHSSEAVSTLGIHRIRATVIEKASGPFQSQPRRAKAQAKSHHHFLQ